MKLHLPKALFAAVVAALAVQYADAAVTSEVRKGDNAIVLGTGESAKTYNVTLLTGNSNTGIKVGNSVTLEEGTILGFGMTSSTTGTTAPGRGSGNYFTDTTYSYAGDILVYDTNTTDSTDMGLIINNGNGDQVITFSGAVSGNGTISILSSAPSTGITFKFTGDMSAYTGNMKGGSKNKYEFNGATSGTGSLSTTNMVTVVGATMQNSSITAGTLDISGTSSFAGDVTATTLTLGAEANVTFAEESVLTVNSYMLATSGSLTFGNGAKIAMNNYIGLEHGTFGFKQATADLLGGSMKANREVSVTVNGTDYTMATDGTVAGLNLKDDSDYHIVGAVKASDINASGDSIGTDTHIRMTGGTLTMDEDFTVNGTALITGTTITGAADGGKLIVAKDATVQVNSTGCILKSDMEIAAGGTLEFLGTGADATDYNTHGRTITVNGLMDVGTTRQTVGGWIFDMTGGTIQGAGQSSKSNVGLDFHNNNAGTLNSFINAKAAEGATSTSPTVSTISTKVRYNGLLNVDVEENARLDMTGVIVAGNKLTKSGAGAMTFSQNAAMKVVDLQGGKIVLNGTTNSATSLQVASGASVEIAKDKSLVLGSATIKGNSTTNASITYASGGQDQQNTSSTYSVGSDAHQINNARVEIASGNAQTIGNRLVGVELVNKGEGTITAGNGYNSYTALVAESGDLFLKGYGHNAGSVNQGELLNLAIGAQKTITAYTKWNAGDLTQANEATLVVNGSASFGKGATLVANLELMNGTSLTLDGALAMGSTLTLGTALTLDDATLQAIMGLSAGEKHALFTGVDALTLNGTTYNMGTVLDSTSGHDLGTYFVLSSADTPAVLSGENISSGYYLGYTDEGMVYAGKVIPEPTTATLSLLALAALAARRRRK